MPLWLKNIFWRPHHALCVSSGDHDPEWAEFNLPATCDLQALFSMHAERGRHIQDSGGA